MPPFRITTLADETSATESEDAGKGFATRLAGSQATTVAIPRGDGVMLVEFTQLIFQARCAQGRLGVSQEAFPEFHVGNDLVQDLFVEGVMPFGPVSLVHLLRSRLPRLIGDMLFLTHLAASFRSFDRKIPRVAKRYVQDRSHVKYNPTSVTGRT